MKFNKFLYILNLIIIFYLIYFIFISSAQPFIFIMPISIPKKDIILNSLIYTTQSAYSYPRYLTLFVTLLIISLFIKANKASVMSVLIAIFGILLYQKLYEYQVPYFYFKNIKGSSNMSYNIYYLSLFILVVTNVAYSLASIIAVLKNLKAMHK